MPDRPIYLDNHATTRTDPRVVEAMFPYFSEEYGNAGSVNHAYGHAAREAVEKSRKTIAALIGAEPNEIVFTSGATESNNLAIRGVAERGRRRGDHLVSVGAEHHAVLDPLERLRKKGYEVTLLEVAQRGEPDAGRVDPQRLSKAVSDETCLVSVMMANNEIGVLQPIADLTQICRQQGVLFHSDATQAVGKVPINVSELGVDLMSFSAHKLYGPKGIGALYVRGRDPIVRLEPQITGGGQERGRRSGTLNVPGIVGFAKALEICSAEQADEPARLASLRNRLFAKLRDQISGLELCGPELESRDRLGNLVRLPGNLNVHIPGVDGEAILLRATDVAASSGAACSSVDSEPSHVLQGLGYSTDEARCAIRLGLGRFNNEEDIDRASEKIGRAVKDLRVV